jgi:hypothetical protein
MQGFNMGLYIPPDLEGTTTANAASGKAHALGSRARKLKSHGLLTVRFECPFPIWCTTCSPEQIIGQGVRFNAEKKRVGSYYSTPVWSFRVKHTVCGGWIEVRTDPKNTEYVVVEGGRRRDEQRDKVLDGEIVIGATEVEKARLEQDGAFGAVEKKFVDSQALLGQAKRFEQMEERSRRDWEDPYEKSRALRRDFRAGRKARKEAEESAEKLKDKFGLAVEILDEREDDAARARLIDFGSTDDAKWREKALFETKPINRDAQSRESRVSGKLNEKARSKKRDTIAERKASLAHELRGNTRAAINPFSTSQDKQSWQPSLKRKRPTEQIEDDKTLADKLVEYDTDSPYRLPAFFYKCTIAYEVLFFNSTG